MIREAQASDLPRLVDLGAKFHVRPRWPEPITFDAEDFAETCRRLLEVGVIFLSDGGLLGLIAQPSIYNHSVRVCAELFFWAPDGQGDALRKAAEAWAKDRAVMLILSGHEPGPIERIANWYRRKGYAPIGRQFAKVI